MDRIDIHIDVPAVKFNELRGKGVPAGDTSDVIRERVLRARRIQLERLGSNGAFSNSAMTPKQTPIASAIISACFATPT